MLSASWRHILTVARSCNNWVGRRQMAQMWAPMHLLWKLHNLRNWGFVPILSFCSWLFVCDNIAIFTCAHKFKGLLAIGVIIGTCYTFVFVRFLGNIIAIFILHNTVEVYWEFAHLWAHLFLLMVNQMRFSSRIIKLELLTIDAIIGTCHTIVFAKHLKLSPPY